NLAKNAAERDVDGHVFGRALLEAAIESGYVADDLIVRPAVARARKVGPSMNPPAEHKTRVEGFGSGHGVDEGRPSPAELPATPQGTTPHVPHAAPQTPQPPPPEPRASTPAPAPAGAATAKDDSMLGTSTSAESLRVAGVPRRGRAIAAIAVAGLVAVAGL